MNKLLLIALFVSSTCFAQNVWHTAKIKYIYPHNNGSFVLRFETDSSRCISTNAPKFHYIEIGQGGVTQEGSDKIYSAALAAGLSGKAVQ